MRAKQLVVHLRQNIVLLVLLSFSLVACAKTPPPTDQAPSAEVVEAAMPAPTETPAPSPSATSTPPAGEVPPVTKAPGTRAPGGPVVPKRKAVAELAAADISTPTAGGGLGGGTGVTGGGTTTTPPIVVTISPSPAPSASPSPRACTTFTSSQVLALLGTGPVFLAAHPNGSIYFTGYNGNQVGYYDPSTNDFVTSPPGATGLPANSGPAGITLGPDGKFWVAEFGANRIDEFDFDSSDMFELHQYPFPTGDPLSGPFGTALGADGNVWFTTTSAAALQSITAPYVMAQSAMAEVAFGTPVAALAQASNTAPMPTGIVVGTDGALWFAETGVDKIARFDPNAASNALTEFPVTPCSAPSGLVVGSDGNLWFTEPGTEKIAKMAMTGSSRGTVVAEYTLQPHAVPVGITSGPDCNVWFTEVGTDMVGTVGVTSGIVTETITLSNGADPAGITLGADGNLYVAESGLNAIAQIKVPAPAGSSNQCAAPVFPTIASCQDGPITVATSPGLCTAQVTPSDLDAGSSDPNSVASPAAKPMEAVSPAAPIPAGVSTTVALLVSPAPRPSGAPGVSPKAPEPISACKVEVTTKDEEKPQIKCAGPVTAQCTGQGSARVTIGSPTAADNCPNLAAPQCNPASGATFGLGQSAVTCTVADAAGNFNQCTTSVTVQDTTPPVISSLAANPSALRPDGKTDQVTIVPTVTDTCDPTTPVCTITGVTGGNDSIAGQTVSVVAQPNGPLFPRTFTASVKCVDEAGNSATSSVQFHVRSPLEQALLDLIGALKKLV
jgi:virginiamycin B lyase